MISEFDDLSDKIERLAALTLSLRRENAHLRQSNALLSAENVAFMERLRRCWPGSPTRAHPSKPMRPHK